MGWYGSGLADEASIRAITLQKLPRTTEQTTRVLREDRVLATAQTPAGLRVPDTALVGMAATKLAAGAIPAGVTLPAAQLSAGTVPGGVSLAATQLTGTVPAARLPNQGAVATDPGAYTLSGTYATDLTNLQGLYDLARDLRAKLVSANLGS